MNESGNDQGPTPIAEILPEVIGVAEDQARKAEVAARDLEHEVHGYEGDVQNLAEEAELNPGDPALAAALQAKKAEHLSALADQIEQRPPSEK